MEHVPLGDTPITRCIYYRRVCGLPATIDPPELGRITMPADLVWALMMPAGLGQHVKTYLERRRGADPGVGPIISHLRSNRWTFLIRPDLPDDTPLFAEMFRLNVSVVRIGATIALPSPTDEGAQFRRWIELPRCTFRPSGLAVVDAIRACTGGPWTRPTTTGGHR
ncbi:DNA-directed RNA polymerase subunit beta [Nocardia cyriacigeorgica]|uniref:DNA-directed RNA polymerase subunit beta n=1 Tax=Nocardia cyriacigeorgica TaxID=135487 RepID=UPI0018940965|nr:DNA-directed RNA polymerase subunit beta [Nocardia cyriacigeorgica]MBF6437873.1 DNA-directed RNA polymerase subunit beta [Nocardia cyriacigeorgica]